MSVCLVGQSTVSDHSGWEYERYVTLETGPVGEVIA